MMLLTSIMTVLPAIAADPKANLPKAPKLSQADQRAAEEYRQLGLTYRKQERFDEAIASSKRSCLR